MKVRDVNTLGKNIVVQGGTFYNDAVLRAFELITKKNVIRPDIAGLMGAYGVALLSKEQYQTNLDNMLGLYVCHATYKNASTRE